MHKVKTLRNQRVVLEQGRFVMEIKAIEVPTSRKFPNGIKLKCILIDMERKKPILLLDNHDPFGFHLHTRLPDDPDFRVSLDVEDYNEAIRTFFAEVRKVISHEE
jgi:hypothetical protein